MSTERARGWCFTYNLNNDEPWHHDRIGPVEEGDSREEIARSYFNVLWRRTIEEGSSVVYIIFQPEIAPTTGKRHYQGYLYYKQPVRFGTVKAFLTDWGFENSHIERAKGGPDANKRYCEKEESRLLGGFVYEYGTFPKQGKRTDLEMVATAIEQGESLYDIAVNNPGTYMKFHSGIKAMNALMKCKPRDPSIAPTVYWWFGPTGVGKSRKAFETFPEAYVKMNSMWWDGYEGQTTVIIDDYRPSLCTFQELLRILDRYPMRIQMKGSSSELSATHFVISTTQRPEVIWHGRTEEAMNQLLRRITHIVEFGKRGEEHFQTILKDHSTIYTPLSNEKIQELTDNGPISKTFFLHK